MNETPRIVELDENDALSKLAEEVAATRHVVVLRKHGHDVAMIAPVEPHDDVEEREHGGLLRFAGIFKGLADEELFDEIYRSRSISTRNPFDH